MADRGYSIRRTRHGVTIELDFTPLQDTLNRAQSALDAQVLNDMIRYMPIMNGHLIQQTRKLNETEPPGKVLVYPPTLEYGHYQYEGKKYVDPVYRKGGFFSPSYGWWSRPGITKVDSGLPLHYSWKNPNARSHWDQVAIDNHYSQWFDLVKRIIEEGEK